MNRLISCLVTVLAISLVCFAPATAVEYVDIDQSSGPGGMIGDADWQQTFIPTANNITAVSLYLQFSVGTATVQILDGLCGNVLAHGSGTGQNWVKCDLVGAEALVPGNSSACPTATL